MNSLSIIMPAILIGGLGVLVLFIVAIVQESKATHKSGFRQAFFTMVALILLAITIGSSVALLNVGFRQWVFRSANLYQQRFSSPPQLYLPSQGAVVLPLKDGGTAGVAPVPGPTTTAVYQCGQDCQFTEADKAAVTQWQTDYTTWQKNKNLSQATRQSIANALGFLIVSLPLFILFFRWMEQGFQQLQAKTSPLRSLYFYFVAFIGLLMAVVSTGFVVNDGLRVWLKTTPDNGGVISEPFPASTTDYGVKSLLACKDKCGFTAEQVTLAKQWVTDNTTYQELQRSNKGQFSSDMATAIPFILVGLPLFLFHFSKVRKDNPEPTSPPAITS